MAEKEQVIYAPSLKWFIYSDIPEDDNKWFDNEKYAFNAKNLIQYCGQAELENGTKISQYLVPAYNRDFVLKAESFYDSEIKTELELIAETDVKNGSSVNCMKIAVIGDKGMSTTNSSNNLDSYDIIKITSNEDDVSIGTVLDYTPSETITTYFLGIFISFVDNNNKKESWLGSNGQTYESILIPANAYNIIETLSITSIYEGKYKILPEGLIKYINQNFNTLTVSNGTDELTMPALVARFLASGKYNYVINSLAPKPKT